MIFWLLLYDFWLLLFLYEFFGCCCMIFGCCCMIFLVVVVWFLVVVVWFFVVVVWFFVVIVWFFVVVVWILVVVVWYNLHYHLTRARLKCRNACIRYWFEFNYIVRIYKISNFIDTSSSHSVWYGCRASNILLNTFCRFLFLKF